MSIPSLPVAGSSQIIPLEFHRSINNNLWIDLNEKIQTATKNANYYFLLYQSSPYIICALTISAYALAYIYAPTLFLMIAGSTLYLPQFIKVRADRHQDIADEFTLFLEKEKMFQRTIQCWEDVRAKMQEYRINDEPAKQACFLITEGEEEHHQFMVRALAIEDVLQMSAQELEQKVETLQPTIQHLQEEVRREQYHRPSRNLSQKIHKLEEQSTKLFNIKTHLIQQKIRAAFVLYVLSNPTDTRKIKKFGTLTLKDQVSTYEEQQLMGIQTAFVRKDNDTVTLFSRDDVLTSTIHQLAQQFFGLAEYNT